MAEDWAKKILNYFESKPDITIKKIVKNEDISLSNIYLNWNLKFSPKQFLSLLRLAKAIKLLSYNTHKIEDVADELKFCDHIYFCKWFKKSVGISPKKFQLKYGMYFRLGKYNKIKIKNLEIGNILWALKILENG